MQREGKYVLRRADARVKGREKVDPTVEVEGRRGISTDKQPTFQRIFTLVPLKAVEKEKLPKIFRRGTYLSIFKETKASRFNRVTRKLKALWKQTISKDYILRGKQEKEKGEAKVMVEIAPMDFSAIDISRKVPFAPSKTVLKELKSHKERFEFGFDVKVKAKKRRYLSGKRALAITSVQKGRIIGYEIPKSPTIDIAFGPTIRVAALRQMQLAEQLAIQVELQDLRTNVRMYKTPITILLVLDLSESMVYHLRTIAEAVFSLHRKAYRYRDRVGLIVLQGERARIVFHPTTNINIVARKITELKAGGSTPLADGLLKAIQILTQELRRNPHTIPIVVLVSDGLANVPLKQPLNMSLREKIPAPAQADVIAATQMLARKNIPVVVVNPVHIDKWDAKLIISPTHLLIWIAQVTRGRYYGFKTGLFKTTLTPERMTRAIEKAIISITVARTGKF